MDMKKALERLILLLFIFLGDNANAQNVVKTEVTPVHGNVVLKASSLIKQRRVKGQGHGKIIANIPDNAPLFFATSLKAATELWENILDNTDTVSLHIEFRDTTGSMEVSTVYYAGDDGISRPSALHRKLLRESVNSNPDIHITIYSPKNWTSGFSQEDDSLKNLSLSLARAIGIGLGFGTSVKNGRRSTQLFYAVNQNSSIFDSLITNSTGGSLSENQAGNRLYQYYAANYNDLYAGTIDDSHILYARQTFDENSSLRYLENGESIMSYNLPDSVDMFLDNIVLELMSRIGWNCQPPVTHLIIPDDVDSTGICSAYEPHRFHLARTCMDPQWKYILHRTDGTEDIISTSNEQTFTTPAITNATDYMKNIEGDIIGRVVFEGTIDGVRYTDEFRLFLELSPQILDVTILQREDLPYCYSNFKVGINYRGCYLIEYFLREEYSYNVQQFINYTPFYTELNLNGVDTYGRAWLEIYAWNQYGSDHIELELTGNGDSGRYAVRHPDSYDTVYQEEEIENILVYNLQNKHVLSIRNESEIAKLPRQIYILKYVSRSGKELYTRKICLK